MGIKYFFSWFRKNFPERIKSLRWNKELKSFSKMDKPIDNLMIDLNGIFHTCAQYVYMYGQAVNSTTLIKNKKPPTIKQQNLLFSKIWEEIIKIVDMAKPRKRIILCIDGVAPISKQNQQRQRRFRAAKTRENKEDFDSNCITPGTKFMDFLSKSIDYNIKNYINNDPYWKTLDVIFSNEKVPGEGEHKLINFIRFYGNNNESYCIHGMDADLIMLSLSTHKKYFHILRPNHRNRSEVFHIDLESIREEIIKTLKWENKNKENKNNICNDISLIDDFIFMLFSVGNDFLPHLPCIEILEDGIEILFETYIKNSEKFGHLTYRNKIDNVYFNNISFSEFLDTLGMYEKNLLDKKVNNSNGSFMKDSILENNTKIIDGKYKVDFESYKKEYYSKKIGDNYQEISLSYIEGLQWVLSYYTIGVPSWSWYYPCYYVPFSSDLSKLVRNYEHIKYPRTLPLSPFEQLLCVLPPLSKELLPNALHDILGKNSPLSELYPEDFKIDMEGKRNDWEAIALLPMIDIEKIKKAYKDRSNNIDKNDIKRNIIGMTYIYKYVDNYQQDYVTLYGTIKNCSVKISRFEL